MKRLSILIITIIALGLTACSPAPEAATSESSGEEIVLSHELGETVINGLPERVVVFDYGILDAIDTIGEDIVGLPKQTLPTYLDKYNGDEYTDVGSLKEPNFEVLYELNPDLIIISTRQLELYDQLSDIAPTLYLTVDGGSYMEDFKHNMDVIGQIYDKEDILLEEVAAIEKDIEELHDLAISTSNNALFIMANDGNLSAYGTGSRFGMIHNEFGIEAADPNIDASTHGQKVTFEYIMEQDADYIFVMDRAIIAGGETSAMQVMDNEIIRSTRAFESDNIIYLDPFTWYVSSGGLTGTQNMIEEISEALSK